MTGTLVVGEVLRLAALGYHVFPLTELSKVPKIPKTAGGRGFFDATVDTCQIRAWWERWPRANVAIRTGECSGLLVLDIDIHKGGFESLSHLEDTHCALPATLSVITPTGGRHHYFVWPPASIGNTAGKLGPGIDTRGDGGYVAAPPSRRAEGTYRWVDSDAPVVQAPGWLVQLIAKPKPVPRPVFVASRRLSGQRHFKMLDRAVREVAAAPCGQGNAVLNGASYSLGRMVGSGLLDRHVVEEALVTAALGRWGETEARIRAVVASGLDAGQANPRMVVRFESVVP